MGELGKGGIYAGYLATDLVRMEAYRMASIHPSYDSRKVQVLLLQRAYKRIWNSTRKLVRCINHTIQDVYLIEGLLSRLN
jgi:adenine-specific DNA methylase